MQEIVGTEHALTLLRPSLRYCQRAEPARRAGWDEHGQMLTTLLEEFHLLEREPGIKPAEDAFVQQLSQTFATGSQDDVERAAATALSEGFDPAVTGEAIALAASHLVLRDGGRLPQWEDRLKKAGSVHGDSAGVHASGAASILIDGRPRTRRRCCTNSMMRFGVICSRRQRLSLFAMAGRDFLRSVSSVCCCIMQ